MGIGWGLAVVVLSMLCWAGQLVSWLWPQAAARMSMTESESTVEPTYFADIRGEAAWDSLTLWTMPVAGVLLIIDNSAWTYFGLIGGAMYVYFAGRGIFTRMAMSRRGYRVGLDANVKLGYVFLAIWGVTGLVTILAAVIALTQ